MRALTLLVLLFATLYGGYWVVGSSLPGRALEQGAEALEGRGWEMSWETAETRGFPSRFDTTLTGPQFTAPNGASWAGEFLQVFALSYAPNRMILVGPPEQRLSLAGREAVLHSPSTRANLNLSLQSSVALADAALEVDEPRLASGDWTLSAGRMLLALRPGPGAEGAVYDLFGEVADLGPGAELTLNARLTLSAPLDRDALSSGADLQELAVDGLEITGAGGRITLTGDLRWRTGPRPTGTLGVTAEDPGPLLALLEEIGLMPAGSTALPGPALTALSSGREIRIDVQDGIAFLGPVELGPLFP